MIQLLHISDVHLNAGYANKNENVRHKLRDGLTKAVKNAVDYTLDNRLEGIIIAGDFFEHDKISFKDEFFVLEHFSRILENNQKIFYVSGNHDPMKTAEFLQTLRKHENFYHFDDDEIRIESITSREGQPYKVVAVGHKSKNEKRNLIKNFPIKSDQEVWIGIGHASVPSALSTSEKESYMAVALSQIESLNYDYFALGHIHIRQKLTQKIAYSGNIQGLNIKETGPKGGILVQLDSGVTHLEDVNFNTIGWIQIESSIPNSLSSLHELQDFLVSRIMESIEESQLAARQLIVRVHLIGKTILKSYFEDKSDIAYMLEMIKEKTGILSLELKSDKLRRIVEIESLINEQTVLSQMIHRIKDNAYEPELLNKLLDLPIFTSKDATEDRIEYIKQLQEILLEEVVERMVVSKNDH